MSKRQLHMALLRLSSTFDSVDVFRIEEHDDWKRDLLRSAAGYDSVIVAGGDGTFNHAIDALAGLEKMPTIGFLNAGTLGDVGRSFGISRGLRSGLKAIQRGKTMKVDIVKINSSHFVYMAAIGAYSGIAYRAPKSLKRILGRFAYYDLALAESFRRELIKVRLTLPSGESIEAETPFLLLLNGKKVGGFSVNRRGSVNDGQFEVFITAKGAFNGLLNYFPKNRITPIKATDLTIESDFPGPWCIDGEIGPKGKVRVSILRGKMTIYCSDKALSGSFS